MKFSNLFWALILIAIGLLFLLSNFGWVDFHWSSIWRLWPLILVFWGISILPIRNVVKTILVIAFIALTFIFFNQITEPRWNWSFHGDEWTWSDKWDRDDWDDKRTYRYETQELSVPYEDPTSKSVLIVDAAAGKYIIGGETADLLSFCKEGDIGNYSLTTKEKEGKTVIRIKLEKDRKIRHVKKNKVNIQLNPDPVWDLDLDVGAAAVNMDLSGYKIDTAVIDAGAASIELKLGDLNPLTFIDFSAGAASLEIRIPKGAACEIHSESVLVSRDFKGFIKKGGGIYQTENYPEGTNKIIIDIESAVSSLTVTRY